MGDENQLTKKRAAGRELSRDNPGLDDDEEVPGEETGTFKKASDEVLATRRIVKVRRQQTSTAPPSSAPSSNPFANIRLVPPVPPAPATAEPKSSGGDAAAIKDESEDTEGEVQSKESGEKSNADEEKAAAPPEASEADKGDASETAEKPADKRDASETAEKPADERETAEGSAEKDDKQGEDEKGGESDDKENEKPDASGGGGAPLSSFQQLSNSQNAFTGLAGTGFSTSLFSFGSAEKDGSPSSLPTFSFGTSSNGSTSLFGNTTVSIGTKSEATAFPPMQEVPRETGEENEETVFSADSALFEFFDGGWKERGKGEVKVNVLKSDTQKARLVMRAKGNLRLILNASLYPDMKLTKMEKKGVTFACVNTASEGKDGLSTFALKFRDGSIVEEFSAIVSAHKGKPAAAAALKTPENSPKASDD